MSAPRGDRALRALERDASGGDPDARARLLLARTRHGALRRPTTAWLLGG